MVYSDYVPHCINPFHRIKPGMGKLDNIPSSDLKDFGAIRVCHIVAATSCRLHEVGCIGGFVIDALVTVGIWSPRLDEWCSFVASATVSLRLQFRRSIQGTKNMYRMKRKGSRHSPFTDMRTKVTAISSMMTRRRAECHRTVCIRHRNQCHQRGNE